MRPNAAARGKPAVVLFYDVGAFMRLDADGQRQYQAIFAALRRCQERGATVLAFSTDVNAMVLGGLPDYLQYGDAPFPAVSLYRWPRGQLTRAMASIGIPVGAGWTFPVVLVLDRDGQVAMQIQDAFDWGTRNDLGRIEAILGDMRRRESRRMARAN
jgi:hypothetical protein